MSEELNEDELKHIGVARKSGRYPWGSGENPRQRQKTWLDSVAELKSKGLTETQIAKGLGLSSTTELRVYTSIAKNETRKADASEAMRLKEKGYSNVAIGKKMGKNESSIRALLEPAAAERRDILQTVAKSLREQVKPDVYLDIGEGTQHEFGVAKDKLSTAVAILKTEGYKVMYVKVPQLGTKNFTSVKVLVGPDVTYSEVYKNTDRITTFNQTTKDYGRTFYGLTTPKNVKLNRVSIVYDEDGGSNKDGIIELRPGVDDLNLGKSRYAQVRISVNGTHYLKGMAVYANDLPDGVDIRFNTNKSKNDPKIKTKLDVMKPLKDDPDNPFGAVIKPGGQRGALNILNEEGDWFKWSNKLSSQMLSKQNPSLIKEQLGLTFAAKKQEFDDIMALTNPTVKRKLLETFADDADSSSVTLKAMGLPRTRNHVILPIPSLKDNEVYAPQYRNGEKVVLIRHPHGGIFEIPELQVNNRNRDAIGILGRATDAIAINPNVAKQLSGADFDGDSVLVIPNTSGSVKSSKAITALKEFDPRASYGGFDGMKKMTNTQTEMGNISNLITDMTIRGASAPEIVRAVRHSMVVIDAEKHGLNYKQSYADHGIRELKNKYQGGITNGASTLISRASSDLRVDERKPRPAALGGAIDPKTGEKVFVKTGVTYPERIPRPDSMGGPIDKATGKKVFIETGVIKTRTTLSTRLGEAKDAYELSSGTPREALYADYANKLKALANDARKNAYSTPPLKYSPTAKVTYDQEVKSLEAKLQIAFKNKPLERQAQILANNIVNAKKADNPNMDKDEIKKMKGQALNSARERVGAKKQQVIISPIEWEAIQAGAISNSRLSDILDNTDIEQVKTLATPRTNTVMSSAKTARANSMFAAGYTQAEIADALGVPTTTLNAALNR
jgi:DNA-binding CsgD family transcriptional regulator